MGINWLLVAGCWLLVAACPNVLTRTGGVAGSPRKPHRHSDACCPPA